MNYLKMFKLIPVIAAIISISLAVMVMFGWYTHQIFLIQIHPHFAPMQLNTALGFLLSGISLLALINGRGRISAVFGSLAGILGLMTLSQYVFDYNLGIDQLFVEGYVMTKTSHPGRMAPNTALCFSLTGMALVFSSVLINWRYQFIALWGMIIAVITLSFTAMIGYVGDLETAYGWSNLTRMALHTSIGFIILNAGLAVYILDLDEIRVGKTYLIAAGLGSTILLLAAALSVQLWGQKNESREKFLKETGESLNSTLQIVIDGRLLALERMRDRWQQEGGTPRERWGADALNYIHDISGLKEVQWIDSNRVIRWVEPKGRELKNYLEIVYSEDLKSSNKTICSSVFDETFAACLPLFVHGKFDGFILSVFSVDEFLYSAIPKNIKNQFQVFFENNGKEIVIQELSKEPVDSRLAKEYFFKIANQEWKLTIAPNLEYSKTLYSKLPMTVFLSGLFISVLFAFVVHLALVMRIKSLDLKNSEETFRLAIELAPIGMGLLKPNGDWLKVNPRMCEIFGYSQNEMLSKKYQSLICPEDLYSDQAYIEQAIAGKINDYKMEKRYFHKLGNIIWALLSVSLVRDRRGKPNYFIVQIQDITQEKEIGRLKNEFISVVSHELRTPLTSIRGSLGLICGAFSKNIPDQVNQLAAIAYSNCERLILLINDILDIDKITAGEMRFNMREDCPKEIVMQAVKANMAYAQKYNVSIKLDLSDKNMKIHIDSARLIQVLSNLLSNAIKFSPQKGVVLVSTSMSEGCVRISVKDSGGGIPREFRTHIFQKFAQADSSSTRAKGGTGLGLYITKQIVERMNGKIDFDSEVGGGTTFWVEFMTVPI